MNRQDEGLKSLGHKTIGAYQSYKEKYPNGLHTEEATKIIDGFHLFHTVAGQFLFMLSDIVHA